MIEDDFCNGRPPWEEVGVQFTDNVAAFEEMKIGLLNGSHLSMALLGVLYGLDFAHQTMQYSALQAFVRDYMDRDVTPKLTVIANVDFSEYKDTLISRFSNPIICDQLQRIGSDASSKFPKFILPTLQWLLENNQPIDRVAMIIAAWMLYLKGTDEQDRSYSIPDPKADVLLAALAKPGHKVTNFLALQEVFGNQLSNNSNVVEAVEKQLENLKTQGVNGTLALMGYR